MFVCIKKRHIVIAILLIGIILFSAIFATNYKTEYVYIVPNSKYLVLIDPGHGGIDGGCVGIETGVYESELNLTYSRNLASQLMNMGISAKLTRTDENGLYDESAKNLKKSDMKKRKEIIEQEVPTLVVSIHMNSYTLRSSRGAQTFYKNGNEEGKTLAMDIQSQLKSNLGYVRGEAQVGDYYIVNCTEIPSVLVECGFLSNQNEERLLIDKDYQDKVCYAIMCGIVKYLNEN